jgi:hypothetical protein
VVWHDDLSLRNILVDDNGSVTAILGWYAIQAREGNKPGQADLQRD